MTPEERAEKIIQWHVFRFFENNAGKISELPNITEPATLKDVIAAEIREAVEEAVRVPCLSAECGLQAFAEGKRFAYEKAAKIAEMYLIHDPDDGQHGGFIANAIRALAAEEK